MDQSEIRRLAVDYDTLTDQQLWAVIDCREELGTEAATAAAVVLAQRSGAAVARVVDPVRCDCCGGDDQLKEYPFVAARDGGYTFTSVVKAVIASTMRTDGQGIRSGRHLIKPQLLTLRICADCRMRLSFSEPVLLGLFRATPRLRAEAYTHHPDYAALEREGYNVIIDRHDMPMYGFGAPVIRLT